MFNINFFRSSKTGSSLRWCWTDCSCGFSLHHAYLELLESFSGLPRFTIWENRLMLNFQRFQNFRQKMAPTYIHLLMRLECRRTLVGNVFEDLLETVPAHLPYYQLWYEALNYIKCIQNRKLDLCWFDAFQSFQRNRCLKPSSQVPCSQCDHIGWFLKVLEDKSSSNVWWLFENITFQVNNAVATFSRLWKIGLLFVCRMRPPTFSIRTI